MKEATAYFGTQHHFSLIVRLMTDEWTGAEPSFYSRQKPCPILFAIAAQEVDAANISWSVQSTYKVLFEGDGRRPAGAGVTAVQCRDRTNPTGQPTGASCNSDNTAGRSSDTNSGAQQQQRRLVGQDARCGLSDLWIE